MDDVGPDSPNHEQSVIIYSPVFGDKYPDAARNRMVTFVRGVRDYVRAFDGPELPDDAWSRRW